MFWSFKDAGHAGFEEAERLYSSYMISPHKFRATDGVYPEEALVDVIMEDGVSRKDALALLSTDNCIFVQLLNYKGECEGFELLEKVKHLPTFRGKYK